MQLQGTQNLLSHIDLTELNKADALKPTDELLVGTQNGNVKIPVGDAVWEFFDSAKMGSGLHNSIWRGNNIGTYVTDKQYAAIADGTFTGMYVGDFWLINGTKWRIMGFNYWVGSGFPPCTTQHVVVMPDTILHTAKLNETNTTEGGYFGCGYATKLASSITKPIIDAAFPRVLKRKELLSNSVSIGGFVDGVIWADSEFELPTELMTYGSNIYSSYLHGNSNCNLDTSSTSQLPGFSLKPELVHTPDRYYWLRDVMGKTGFSSVSGNGTIAAGPASDSRGIRPVFAIY